MAPPFASVAWLQWLRRRVGVAPGAVASRGQRSGKDKLAGAIFRLVGRSDATLPRGAVRLACGVHLLAAAQLAMALVAHPRRVSPVAKKATALRPGRNPTMSASIVPMTARRARRCAVERRLPMPARRTEDGSWCRRTCSGRTRPHGPTALRVRQQADSPCAIRRPARGFYGVPDVSGVPVNSQPDSKSHE